MQCMLTGLNSSERVILVKKILFMFSYKVSYYKRIYCQAKTPSQKSQVLKDLDFGWSHKYCLNTRSQNIFNIFFVMKWTKYPYQIRVNEL